MIEQRDKLNSIYEDVRNILLQTDPIVEKIKQIKNPQLQKKMIETVRTFQADAMILTDMAFVASECETDSDMELLLS